MLSRFDERDSETAKRELFKKLLKCEVAFSS